MSGQDPRRLFVAESRSGTSRGRIAEVVIMEEEAPYEGQA